MRRPGGPIVPNWSVRRWQFLALALGVLLLYLLVHSRTITRQDLLLFGVLIPSIILHEISHGLVALACGDDTAKRAGRLTLNPLAHVDPFGTVLLPLLMLLSGLPPWGWAKPVPVSLGRLRSPRNQGLLVALVGPFTNVLLAVLAAVIVRWPLANGPVWAGDTVFYFGAVNVLLAVFNLFPIPPLDGSAVLERLLPASWWPGYLRFRQWSMLLVFALVVFRPGIILDVVTPSLMLWERVFNI